MECNLADLFEGVVDAVPDNEALVLGERGAAVARLSYAELDERANRLANALAARGVGVGDRIGLDQHNGLGYVEGMLAAYKLRAVPVNVNYRYVAEELRYLFADAGLVGVLTEPALREPVDGAVADLDGVRFVLEVGPGYEDELASSSPERPPVGPRSADDLYLLYTGGTTGMPKGVMWRHEDIYFAALGGRGTPSAGIPPLARPEDIGPRAVAGDPIDRRLPLCPLMHGGAMWVALQTLLNGGAAVLSTDLHFDPDNALGLLASERVALTMLIGDATGRPLADRLEADPDRYDLGALQVIASGGAILAPDTKARLRAALPGTKIVDTFGASETGGQGRLSTTSDGRPRLVTDDHTAVLDDEGRRLGPGDGIGRLARSGWIPLGYWGDDAKTAATFPVYDGVRWSIPGDQARVEDDGTITVLGRGAMCINTGGEKVFPEEVEGVLKGHPAVFDALVVGLPDERFGQRVVAVVSGPGAPPEVDEAALATHARAHLSGYKVPRAWVLVDHCQRHPTGKPDYVWAAEVAQKALADD